RGSGYRLGPIASTSNGGSTSGKGSSDSSRAGKGHSQSSQSSSIPVEPATLQQSTLRALVNSVAHDLAQPLTSVRCFLEVAGIRNGANAANQGTDLKSIEQQADRAIALAKTLSSLARDVPAPSGPWVSLDTLLQEVFNDFIVLLHSGMLTLERQWDSSIQVTSSPVLRQLLVLLVGKLIGRNTRPLTMTVSTNLKGSKCNLEMRWRITDASSQSHLQDVKIILGKELPYIHEMVYSIGGELILESDSLLYLKLPAGKQDLVQ
ncbi:MAG TPA: histidine kinase dimerization/phospho-acceptor domain-containing protein, partial [Candidatus Angelobacter sp.]|nr:histidine kinase dimerization/phospho-acceptor domain-containing protein [Candidatus Angelobacter sp.]